jgi:Tfp pilus assembly protein PilO
MNIYRRRRNQYLFVILLGVIGVINVLFFFILYRPVRAEYFRLQGSIQKGRADVQSRRQKIDRLEKLSAQLETSAQDRQRLYTTHFIPTETGWSEILPQLNRMTQTAGVKNSRKEYNKDGTPQYGLHSVKITLPVTGPYANVMRFIKEIEKSNTFFIINSIDVRGAKETSTRSADVSMNLNLETFFYR